MKFLMQYPCEACIIKKHAVHLALGVNMEGKKKILGMWISENEGAKFWMKVITEIKNLNWILLITI